MSNRRASVTSKSNEALDRLVSAAREDRPSFDPNASLAGALAKREHRTQRAKTVRRAIVAASSASFLLLLLVRASAAPSPDASAHERGSGVGAPPAETTQLAARTLDDGGYARD